MFDQSFTYIFCKSNGLHLEDIVVTCSDILPYTATSTGPDQALIGP